MAGNQNNVLLLATLAAIVGICSAASFKVGDAKGWTIPSGSSFYSDWAKKQTFQVGDQLVFNFPLGTHTVAEVSKAAYDACTTANPLSAVKTTAPANYTLSSAGNYYYICTITGHCNAGQKLAVTATGPSSAPVPKSSNKTPSPAPDSSHSASSPSGATTSPTAGVTPAATGPSAGVSTPPPAGNFAAPTAAGVSLLSLISLAAAALFF